jgi:hypothetical protein
VSITADHHDGQWQDREEKTAREAMSRHCTPPPVKSEGRWIIETAMHSWSSELDLWGG